MAMRLYYLVGWLVVAAATWGGAGGDGGGWRSLAGGARATALGGAFAAAGDDGASLFFNPAGLDLLTGGECEITYHRPYSQYDDVNALAAVAAYNMSGRGFALGTFAGGVQVFKTGGIWEAGPQGLTGRQFSDYEMTTSLGWGKGLGASVVEGETPTYYVGGAARVVTSKIHEYQDGGFGLDVGFLWRPLPVVRAGLTFANVVAPNIRLKTMSDTYPATMSLGAAVDIGKMATVAVQGNGSNRGDPWGSAGMEFRLAEAVAARGGYSYPAGTPTAGLGVRVKGYGFDFAWRPHNGLGDSYLGTAIFTW